MRRAFEILGLALVGIFAMGVLVAPSAFAQEPAIRSDGPVTLSATETGEAEANGFTMFGETIRCPGSTYTGHKVSATPHEAIPNGATAATITPAYKQTSNNCKHVQENIPATIDLNGCDYVVNIGAETSKHKYAATTDIVCSEGQSIKLTVFSGSAHSFKLCTYTIKAQTGLTGLTAKATTPATEDFDIEGAATGVHVVRSGAACEETTTAEGKINLDLTVKGLNGEGKATAVSIDDQDLGPAIRADGPVTLSATETGASEANGFTMFGESIRCPGSTYTGHKLSATPHELIPSGATATTITPAYKQTSNNCKHTPENLPATIDLNGCDYVIDIGSETSEHKFAATTDIVCPEGQSIKLTVFSGSGHSFKLCTYTIKAQTGLTGLTARTTTSEDFDLEGAASGVHVVRSGAACEEATTTEGKISLDLTVKGLNGEGKSTAVVISDEDLLLQVGIRSDGPVTLSATETGAETNGFTSFGETIRCPGSTYTGHKVSATPHELIPSGATAATITPTYKNCISNGGQPVTIDMNGCDYVVAIGVEVSEHKYAAATDFVCPAEKSVQLTVFSSGTHALRLCTLAIKAQTSLAGLSAKTTTSPPEDFDIEGTLTGIHVAKSGLCGTTTTTEGKIDLDLTVKGFDAVGEATAVVIGDEDPS
ncbi:MAG TPA: hypothetical protein VFM94_07805 [Solirubrobacterales bacterium]|nr:hypothetical protein [Solirubrobacterales bacterium]